MIHKDLANGRWHAMSLAQQLGNIGGEVYRVGQACGKDKNIFNSAVERGLELFDLTLSDPRWKDRLLELGRERDYFCDAVLGGKEYGADFEKIQPFYDQFAILANKELFS